MAQVDGVGFESEGAGGTGVPWRGQADGIGHTPFVELRRLTSARLAAMAFGSPFQRTGRTSESR